MACNVRSLLTTACSKGHSRGFHGSFKPAGRHQALYLLAVPVALEVEVELKRSAVKRCTVPVLLLQLPFPVNNFERYVFVRRAGMKADDTELIRVCGFKEKARRNGAVKKVRVKDCRKGLRENACAKCRE
jgi:hypothetical protein